MVLTTTRIILHSYAATMGINNVFHLIQSDTLTSYHRFKKRRLELIPDTYAVVCHLDNSFVVIATSQVD